MGILGSITGAVSDVVGGVGHVVGDVVGGVGHVVGDVAGGVKDAVLKVADKVEDGASATKNWWEKFFHDEEEKKAEAGTETGNPSPNGGAAPPRPPRGQEVRAYVGTVIAQNQLDRSFMHGFETMVSGNQFRSLSLETKLAAVDTMDRMHRSGASVENLKSMALAVNDPAFAKKNLIEQKTELAEHRGSLRDVQQQRFRDQLLSDFVS